MSLHFHDLLFADFSFAQGKSMLFNGAEQKHARVDVHDQLLSNLWRAHASPVAGSPCIPASAGRRWSWPVANVINRYFDGDPPFDFSDSKEFPDALVIEVLSAWCKKRGRSHVTW